MVTPSTTGDDLSSLLSGLSLSGNLVASSHLSIVPPPVPPSVPGQILLHHPAVQLSHSPPIEAPFPYLGEGSASSRAALPTSPYLKDLLKWASEAAERIKTMGCEIPAGLGLNQGDLYLGPGSILAIEGAVRHFSRSDL
jgi:histone deacetylase HOS3